jgi:preprotein translocase subunit SecD
VVSELKRGERATMLVNGMPSGCEAVGDGSLGFAVYQTKVTTLRFGIDVEGGTRVLLSPNETITKEQLAETIKTLENRINFYGLREVKVNALGNNLVQIEMSGATGDDVREFLAKQGRFAGKLSQSVRFVDGEGYLKVANKTHVVMRDGSEIVVNGRSYSSNETFVLENETFEVVAVTNSSALLYARLFTGEDIVNVLSSAQSGGVRSVGDGFYEFSFGIQVSKEGANRFAKLTAGQPVVRTVGTDRYIEPQLLLFLDDRMITDLNIGANIAGQAVTSAVITGTQNGLEEASREKLRLESTLRSGSLPVRMDIAKVDTITQTAGRDLINSTVIVAIGSIIAVGAIVTYRYRDYKVVLPMVLISLSEVVIVIGMAASQVFAGFVIAVAIVIGLWKREVMGVIGWVTLLVMVGAASTVVMSPWTIDIPVIAGLIAILGTGVNQMIIMTDQLFREKGKALNERHKSAMHMIWSSAAIVVFAMIPLILGGIGSLKGFAIATIVGVLVGILVTRPAYVAIIEKVKKVKLESV